MSARLTQFGFKWESAEVVRVCGDKRYGVWIIVRGKREELEVRVTKGGRLRVSKIRKATPIHSEPGGPR